MFRRRTFVLKQKQMCSRKLQELQDSFLLHTFLLAHSHCPVFQCSKCIREHWLRRVLQSLGHTSLSWDMGSNPSGFLTLHSLGKCSDYSVQAKGMWKGLLMRHPFYQFCLLKIHLYSSRHQLSEEELVDLCQKSLAVEDWQNWKIIDKKLKRLAWW